MISDIRLRQFRSYSDESFEFSPGVNIIVGPNASGKTNLLESILVVSRGSSFKVKDFDLIKFKKNWAKIEANTISGNRTVQLENKDDHTLKLFKINDKSLRRLSLDKTLPTVLFEPEHLRLLNAGPELRRDFMDELIEQTTAGYAKLRRQYKRTLAQRNALLKHGPSSEQNIFAWNIRLSELGGQLVQARLALIKTLNQQITPFYNKLAQTSSTVSLIYKSPLPLENYSTNLLHKLESNFEQDKDRGFTGFGPHREDLDVLLDNKVASVSASRGETRTLTLVFKVLEAQMVEQARELKPILLLDDVFSELDGRRRQALTKFLQPYQTFITTTDADVVIQHFTETTNILPLRRKKT